MLSILLERIMLIDIKDLYNILQVDEFLTIDIINSLPNTFIINEIFYKLFSFVFNFEKIILSILDNIKKYFRTLNTNIQIIHELLIQFSQFNLIFTL